MLSASLQWNFHDCFQWCKKGNGMVALQNNYGQRFIKTESNLPERSKEATFPQSIVSAAFIQPGDAECTVGSMHRGEGQFWARALESSTAWGRWWLYPTKTYNLETETFWWSQRRTPAGVHSSPSPGVASNRFAERGGLSALRDFGRGLCGGLMGLIKWYSELRLCYM